MRDMRSAITLLVVVICPIWRPTLLLIIIEHCKRLNARPARELLQALTIHDSEAELSPKRSTMGYGSDGSVRRYVDADKLAGLVVFHMDQCLLSDIFWPLDVPPESHGDAETPCGM